ncbi:hypothetical protein CKAH01_07607 [Colletotrichum kahawae]|uniref:Zinc finger C3HC4 RING-type domain-containing protein n=1 Tax=Colletotrichum kahawae TaxID=34407 RepID=A0AAD9Y6R5_COLKA|nr:hypothetical protein CKAH01_07607 [Colletotrichum kahawae]
MTNSQEHATTGVESIVVYKGDLIGELRQTQHLLRDIDVLQKTYVSQCGHGMCMKCASPMFMELTGDVQATECPLCQQVITHFHMGGTPSHITHSYTIDHIYEPLRLWAAKNMDTETGELTKSPEIVPRSPEIAENFKDDKDCESTDETMEPFHWVVLLLIVGLFALL